MAARRPWRLDMAAIVLLLAGLLVSLAVFSYDPADLPGRVFPTHSEPQNILGHPGAHLAAELIGTLGVAVYVWLAAWFVLVLALFVRRDYLLWAGRLLGWLILAMITAVLAHRYLEQIGWQSSLGTGGHVGVWLDAWLAREVDADMQFSGLIALGVVGIFLAGDFIWRQVWAVPFWLFRSVVSLFRGIAWMAGKLWRRSSVPRQTIPPPLPGVLPVVVVNEEAATSKSEPDGIPIKHHAVSIPPTLPEPAQPETSAPDSSAGLLSERQRFAGFELPPVSLLEDARPLAMSAQDQQLRERATLLEKTFRDFGLNVKVVGINTGPVVTMYEVTLETGLRVAKVTGLGDDIALNLKVPSVRMVTPLPGKNAVGIEIPNELRADVRLKEVILTSAQKISKAKIPLFLGKDGEGRPLVCDLADMPHLLIAGATGTGKSVCLTTIILSLLMTRRPDEVRMVLIDPKSGVEMQWCSKVPHLMSPIIEDMKKAEAVLAWAVDKMEERYDLLKRARVRNIASYNELKPEEIVRRVHPLDEEEKKRIPERISYIVIVIDEMADLMMQFKKEVEGYIIRLAQKSRAAGIHLVLATQKPTVDVITGLIKSNLPSRICFKVAQKSDSRVVLDQMGADKLLGRGDLLFLPPGTSDLVRAQGAYASETETLAVADYLESDPCYEAELLQLKTKEVREAEEAGGSLEERLKTRDKVYEQAVDIVIREGRGSVSLLQRALGIGYGRAARLVDFMAQDGIVGNYNGSNAREVLYTPEQWAALRAEQAKN